MPPPQSDNQSTSNISCDAVFRMIRVRGKMLSRRVIPSIAAIVLIAVIAAPALASPATATRTLPSSVASGATFNVAIEASGCGFAGQVVETLPDGFTYVGCDSEDVGVEQIGNTIKFTFLGDSASFTYSAKAPTIDTITTYTFHGVVKNENKNEYPVDDDEITVTVGGPSPETYTLTMVVDGSGSTTPSPGNHIYDVGDVVSISATPAADWQFDHWSSNVADPDSPSTTVTMNRDKTITAHFSPGSSSANDLITYTLTVTYEPSDGGSVILSPSELGNHYEKDTSIKLTVIPSEGYIFSCWGGDLTGNANPVTIAMDSDRNITANFASSTWGNLASFTISPLNISPEQVQPNQAVSISSSITNNGEKTGTYEALLYVNEQVEDNQLVEISPGSSQNVVFSVTKATPGVYTVLLGEQQGEFTVANNASNRKLDTSSTIAIVVIIVLVVALIFIFRRIRRGT